jgi:hypothetical protein
VTPTEWLFGGLLFGGSFVLLLGIALQLAIGGDAIGIAALIFITTRLAMALMRVFLPQSIPGQPPNRRIAIIWLLVWLGASVLALKVALT